MGLGRQLFSNTAIYGGTTALIRGSNYLLLPLYTAFLSVARFGTMNELYSYIALLNVLYVYGMQTTYFRFAASENEPDVYAQSTTLVLGSSLLFSVLLVLSAPLIAATLGEGISTHMIMLLALVLFCDAAAALPLARLRYLNQPRYFALCRITHAGVQLGLTIFWLGICPWVVHTFSDAFWLPMVRVVYDPAWDIEYVFLANAMAGLVYVALLWRAVRIRPVRMWKPMLRYTTPLLVMELSGVAMEALPRALFRHLYPYENGAYALGLYSAGAKMAIIMLVVLQGYRYAFEPWVLAMSSEAPEKKLSVAMRYYVYAASWLFLSIGLHAKWIGGLLLRTSAYQSGLDAVPVLLLAYVFLGMYYNFSLWYKIKKMTRYGMYFSLVGLGVVVLLVAYLVPVLGYMALAWSLLVGYGGMCWVSYAVGMYHYPVRYHLTWPLLLLGIAIGLVAWQQHTTWSMGWIWGIWAAYTLATGMGVRSVAKQRFP